jgi:hypothetical protein
VIELSNKPTRADGRICLFVPDGRGVRNFVLGPFLREASKRNFVDVFHCISEDVLPEYQAGFNGEVGWHALIQPKERPVAFTLRESLSYAHMYWIDNFPMRRNRSRPVKGSWRTKAAMQTARWLGCAAASPRGMRLLDRLHVSAARRLPEVDHYRRLFEQTRPTVFFCSQQGAHQILAPVLAAKSLGIPTATFIFSWDNLSTKGRIAAPFDHYLVWSDHMRQDLLKYYPEVQDQQIHIVGTPQFDPYADESLLWSRKEFFRRVGADPNRPLICYSGGDAGNAREDPQHVAALMQQIREKRIKHNPQVLLRPAPVDVGTRYDSVRRNYPELVYAQPSCNHTDPGNWKAVIDRVEDIQFMANLTHYADLNINFASTMTLDFAIHDTPVINLAFDVTDPPHFKMSMWDYYQKWDHYRPVIELGAARFARSADELAQHVNAFLDDPSLDRTARERFTSMQIGFPIGQSSNRIAELLVHLSVDRFSCPLSPALRGGES